MKIDYQKESVMSLVDQYYAPGDLNSNMLTIPEEIAKGGVYTIEIEDGILLSTSDFTFLSDYSMTENCTDKPIFQMSFCLDGRIEWSYSNAETEKSFYLGANECQARYGIIEKCQSHFFRDIRCRNVSVTLDSDKCKDILSYVSGRNALVQMDSNQAKVYQYSPNVRRILSEIMNCPYDDELKKLYQKGKVFELMAVFFDEVICLSPTNSFGYKMEQYDYETLLRAKELINQKFTQSLTIPAIAREAAINEQKLKAGFKQCFGCTVNEYITEKRMEMAGYLLKTGMYKVNDVALMAGYTHVGYFIKIYRNHFGISPGESLKTNK